MKGRGQELPSSKTAGQGVWESVGSPKTSFGSRKQRGYILPSREIASTAERKGLGVSYLFIGKFCSYLNNIEQDDCKRGSGRAYDIVSVLKRKCL